jgi:Uma2 family endonuclease
MLIRGEVVEMAAMKQPHYCSVALTADALEAAFGPGFHVRQQAPLDLGYTEPEPDIAVVPDGPRDYKDTPTAAVARIVVEVADTSFDYDRTVKAELYAEAGIADYWILDLNDRALLVLRDPAPVAAGGFAYRTHRTFGESEFVAPLAALASSIRVADLLP